VVADRYRRSTICRMGVDPDSIEPLYEQLARLLRQQIEDGTLPPGRRLPSELHLCQTYEVSRDTARHAIALLRDAGLVATRSGKGTYVVK
jgi:GntR family transcriptional regulator